MEIKKRKSIPKGYVKTKGAIAPIGWEWYNNKQSRFSGKRKIVLVKKRR